MDVIFLIDRSGSTFDLIKRQIELVRELESRVGGGQLAVYSYTTRSMTTDLELIELKALDGPFDETGLKFIGGGGAPTAKAIAEVGTRHAPSRLIIFTDGNIHHREPAVPPAISSLPVGWEVYGLHESSKWHNLGSPWPQLDHKAGRDGMDAQFGNNWTSTHDGLRQVDGLETALTAPVRPQLSAIITASPVAAAEASDRMALDGY
jgi:hypothetical protein